MFTNHEGVTVYPDALAPGTEVGNWRVVERLGVGGYGAAYRVEDMARPGEFCVLKLALRAGDARAEREVVLMMTKVVHPNVVRFHACARWPHPKDGLLGIVMDWVPGPPLHLWAETEGSTFRELARVGGKGALAMGALHERGVLHRDLKPEHIIIREPDGEPVLLDFGAAWYEGADPLTRGMLPPGTLRMRSPEAVGFLWRHHETREAHYSFQRTDDLYALGVCLYRAATGHYPFPETMPDLMQHAIMHQRPASPRDFNRRVPRALSDVIMRLLEKEPHQRYQSGEALNEALVAAVAFGDPKQWDAAIFEWEEVAPENEGDKPQRRIRRPEWPTRPVTPPPPKLVIPPPLPHPPRRVRRGRARSQAAPEPELAGRVTPEPVWTAALRRRAGFVLGAVLGLGGVLLLVAALGLGPWGRARPPPPGASSPSQPTRRLLSGQEVAPSRPLPEIGRAATPTPVEDTPAAAAPLAAPSKDEAPVKKKQQKSPSPQADSPKRGKAAVRGACAGLFGAALQACVSAQQPPPVSPGPPPQACSAEAIQNTRDKLRVYDEFDDFLGTLTAQVPGVDNARPVPVREGFTMVTTYGAGSGRPSGIQIFGQLYFRDGRVHGRFTEARLRSGETIPVCLELSQEGKRGAEMERGSTPERVLMFSLFGLRAVRRFDY